MAWRRGRGTGIGAALLLFLMGQPPAVAEDLSPAQAFRRAVGIHRALLCSETFGEGLVGRYAVEPPPGQAPEPVRDRMIEVLRRRLEAMDRLGDSASIFPRGRSGLEVHLDRPTPAEAEAVRGALQRPGILGFHPVDADSPWWEAIGPALERGLAEHPAWTVRDHGFADERSLRADSREDLEAFVATLPAPPADRTVAFQEEGGYDPARGLRWRLWLLHREPPVHGGHVAAARVVFNEYDQQPVVSLEFTGAGAAAFADLSEALTGRLLAVVLDGWVLSVPKVMERIAGGRAHITLGAGGSPDELLREARDLATVLGSGGHPGRLVFLSEERARPGTTGGWWTLGPLPLTAQAVALLLHLRDGCR
ncbi:MAG: hypothetical protein FJ098_07450 [Deltaproteobacteria bacterium]|nr:hypothetical protein [Deltaproteobacteria bacterium]